jgi:hypothetical protein
MLLEPELPFSRPTRTGTNSGALIAFTFGMSFVAGLLQGASAAMYRSVAATATVFIAIFVVSGIVDRVTHARVEHLAATLEFEG